MNRLGFRPIAVIMLLMFSADIAFALPSGPQVVNGQASFSTRGNNLTVTNTPNSIINWLSFSIGGSEAVRFMQQSSASSVLNRITGQSPSQIYGLLQSNGRVLLINPNGIVFGQGSQVNVAGLVASTLNISDHDFLAGKYNFTAGATAGSIRHQGNITTPSGGSVYLIAPDIENSGIINSSQGTVLLAAGHSVQLVDSSSPDIAVVVSAPADQAVNLGQIIARSGTIGIYGALISQKGIVSADSATVGENGKIIFRASQKVTLDQGSVTSAQGGGKISVLVDMQSGTVNVAGTLDASAPNGGNGGFIETSGANVQIADTAKITTLAPYGKAGTWLIDPYDLTIDSGAATAIDYALGTTGVILQTTSSGATTAYGGTVNSSGSGDININSALSWSANTTLTLSAYRNININSSITATGNNAGLALQYGQGAVAAGNTATYNVNAPVNLSAGGNFSTKLGSDGATVNYTIINSLGSQGSMTGADLQGIQGALTGYYALGSNIDASPTSGWNGGAGFTPVGNSRNNFSGVFEGLGHTIDKLHINISNASSSNYSNGVGLFGIVGSGGIVRNTGLTNANVFGAAASNYVYVGALAGQNNGTVGNSYSTGTVGLSSNGVDSVGGLVGDNYGAISNSFSSASITANGNGNFFNGVGGLVGTNEYIYDPTFTYTNNPTIANSWSAGSVNLTSGNNNNVGGLVGYNSSANRAAISNSYNSGSVTVSDSSNNAGGLVGRLYNGTVTNSYNNGAVSASNGGNNVGGLVGYNSGGSITYAYNTGSVNASGSNSYAGGLAGKNDSSINYTYSSGAVSASGLGNYAGGLVGVNNYNFGNGIVTNSFWDNQTSGQGSTGAGYNGGIFSAFQLTTTQMMSLSTLQSYGWNVSSDIGTTWVMAPDDGYTRPFLCSEYSTTIHNAHQLQLMVLVPTATYALGGNISMSELQNASGMWNSSYSNGTWSGTGFVPIGKSSWQFTGTFNGNNYAIDKLYINSTASYVSLFGYTGTGAVIRNIGLTNVNVTGSTNNSDVGGLVGFNSGGSITSSYSTGAVTGGSGSYVGGLVGFNNGGITSSYSTGAVTGGSGSYAGGLAGENYNGGSITSSYSTGAVNGSGANSIAGGLVGYNNGGSITSSYSTGAVTGGSGSFVGGLVGVNYVSSITGSYSTGAVTGSYIAGGLVGYNNGGSITSSFWDTTTSGKSVGVGNGSSTGVTGMTTAQMQTLANFTSAMLANGNVNPNWNFTTVWRMYDGYTYPLLKSFLTPVTITANNVTKTYDGTSYSGGNNFTYSTSSQPSLPGTLSYTGSSQGARNAGSYSITPTGLYSNQQGYDITFVNGTLTVTKATLTITANANTKTYDGTTSASAAPTVTGLQGPDTVTNPIETYTSPSVGIGKTLTVAGYTINDGNSGGNYNTTLVNNTNGIINADSSTTSTTSTTPTSTTPATTTTSSTSTTTTSPATVTASTSATTSVVSTIQTATTTVAVTPTLPVTSNQSTTMALVDSTTAATVQSPADTSSTLLSSTTMTPDSSSTSMTTSTASDPGPASILLSSTTGGQSTSSSSSSSDNTGSTSTASFSTTGHAKSSQDKGGATNNKAANDQKPKKNFCN